MNHYTAGRQGVAKVRSYVRRNVVAYVALFFALCGGAFAANTYVRSTDTISEGDLAGSTYGKPVIANGVVTNGKLTTSSLTVSPGTGLIGGGSVSLGGSTTLGVADGGIGTTQLHDGSVTTAKFDSGAQTPDAAKLAGASPSDYGAVMSGRMNGLTSGNTTGTDYGAPSGTSTASATAESVMMLTPNHDLKIRDFSVKLATGVDTVRVFNILINGSEAFDIPNCRIVTSTPGQKCTVAGPVDVPANSTLAIEAQTGGGNGPDDALFAFRLTNS